MGGGWWCGEEGGGVGRRVEVTCGGWQPVWEEGDVIAVCSGLFMKV